MASTPLTSTAQLAKALGHPARLRILGILRRAPLPVCRIATALHSVGSTVSGHLRELRRSGLLVEERQGRFVYYRVTDDPAITPMLATIFSSLEADAQIREDGQRVRVLSLLACVGSPQAQGDGREMRAHSRRGLSAAGVPRP